MPKKKSTAAKKKKGDDSDFSADESFDVDMDYNPASNKIACFIAACLFTIILMIRERELYSLGKL